MNGTQTRNKPLGITDSEFPLGEEIVNYSIKLFESKQLHASIRILSGQLLTF
jgi:hypothetical protein